MRKRKYRCASATVEDKGWREGGGREGKTALRSRITAMVAEKQRARARARVDNID